jgi:hypothetical protein
MATGANKQTYMKRYSFCILLVFLLTIGCQEEISIKKGCFNDCFGASDNDYGTFVDERTRPDSPEIPDVPGHPASGEDISFGTQFNPWK